MATCNFNLIPHKNDLFVLKMQCCIDLKKNVLHIGTTGNEVQFITEAELKDKEETRRRQQVGYFLTQSHSLLINPSHLVVIATDHGE